MARRIRNTAELRGFLADAMESLVEGKMSPETAGQVAKLAAQINVSLRTELDMVVAAKELTTLKRDLGTVAIQPGTSAEAET